MPEPLVKLGKNTKPRSRNKDGTWRKKRNDAKRIRTKGHYRSVTRDEDGKFVGAEKWSPKTRDDKSIETLMDEIKALERQVDVLMRDNAELRIKLKAYEREVEVKKYGY